VAVHGGSTMTSTVAQLRRSGGGGKRVAPQGEGGVAPFIAGGGGWQMRRELRAEQRQSGGGSGRGLNAVGTGDAIVRTAWLTGGPQQFQILPIYPKPGEL
jgi:hypothetical protein